MKNIKKILLCFLLIFISIFSVACSKVNLLTTLKSSGEIVTTVEVSLEDLPTSKRHIVYNVLREYYMQLNEKYQESLIYYFSFVYDSEAFNNLSPSLKVEYITSNNLYYLAGDGDCYYDETSYKFFSITKNFASIYAYLMYFCPGAFEYDAENNKVIISEDYKSLIDLPIASIDGNLTQEGNLFITEYIQNTNPFYFDNDEPVFFYDNVLKGISSGDNLVDVIKEQTGYIDESPELTFSFTTPYKRLHSNGNFALTSEGYTHSWAFDTIDGQATFWRDYANYAPWYVCIIAFAVVGLIISLIIALICKKIKIKKSLKTLKAIDEFEISNKKDKK